MAFKIEIFLFFIGVSAATLSFARGDSAFDRAGAHSVGDSNEQRGSTRSPAAAQDSSRTMTPSASSAGAPMYRSSGGGGADRGIGVGRNVSAPDRDAPRTTYTPAPSTPAVQQPSAVVVKPSRDTARTTYAPAPAPQTVREPNVPMAVPNRDANRVTARTAPADSVRPAQTRMPEVTRTSPASSAEQVRTAEPTRTTPAQVETRSFSAPRTSAEHRSVISDSGANPQTQTPSVSAVSTRARTEAVTASHRSDSISTSLVHEPLDGRSNSFRTPTGDRTSALSAETRRDTWPTAPAATRTSTFSRQETASGASRVSTPARERVPAVASLHSTRDDTVSDRHIPASVNRALPGPNLHEGPPRLPYSGHSTVGDRHPSDTRASYSPSFGSTALHQANPYEPPHHSPGRFPDRHYSAYRDTYRPMWFPPAVYPVGFGMTWGSRGAYAFAVASYSPACVYSSSYMPYYDSWSYGRLGCSSVYYGGWRHGWYGGFSYVYNPWPVYSTCYFYDPPQVVTQTETVYVNQPVETATSAPVPQTVAPTPDAAIPVPEAADPTAMPPPVPASEAPPVSVTSTTVSNTPAVAAQVVLSSSTPAGETPSELEYATTAEDFALDFASYAETLNAERIWSSYVGFDRSDPGAELHVDDETAANSPR